MQAPWCSNTAKDWCFCLFILVQNIFTVWWLLFLKMDSLFSSMFYIHTFFSVPFLLIQHEIL